MVPTAALPDKLNLYQLGNGIEDFIVFPKTNLYCRVNHTVKLAQEETNTIDGKIRINGGERNRLGSPVLEVSFIWSRKYYFDFHDLKKIFYYNGLRPVFFYTIENTYLDSNRRVARFFFHPFAEVIEVIQQEQSPELELGQEFELIKVKLQLLTPFVYECLANSLYYFDYLNYFLTNISNPLYYDKPDLTFGQPGVVFGGSLSNFNVQIGRVSNLTTEQIFKYFIEPEVGLTLVYTDCCFHTKEEWAKDGLVNEFDVLIADWINNNNTPVTVPFSFGETKFTTADNKVYVIQLRRSEGPVFNTSGGKITITNVDNKSDLVIEWLRTTPSPRELYFSSFTQKLYDQDYNEIDWRSYRVSQTKPKFLYFSAMSKSNKIFRKMSENIILETEQVNVPIAVEILVLPSYIL